MITSITPLRENVLVRMNPVEKVGTLFVPETATLPYRTGKVLNVGPGRILDNGREVPCSVNRNDTVIFAPGAQGMWLDEEHVLAPDYMFLATIEDEF